VVAGYSDLVPVQCCRVRTIDVSVEHLKKGTATVWRQIGVAQCHVKGNSVNNGVIDRRAATFGNPKLRRYPSNLVFSAQVRRTRRTADAVAPQANSRSLAALGTTKPFLAPKSFLVSCVVRDAGIACDAGEDGAKQGFEARLDALAGFHDFLVRQRLVEDSGGHIGDAGDR
jgi:hypothetical protein